MRVWSFQMHILSIHNNVCFKFISLTNSATRSVKEIHCDIMIFSWLTIFSSYKFGLTAFFICGSGK